MENSNHKYAVVLTARTREHLESITHNGHAPAKKILHSRVLLMSDSNHPTGRYQDRQIAAILGLHVNTVARIRRRFVLQGEGPALDRKVRATPPTPPKLDGRAEAMLVALCCSVAPEGRSRWMLSLLQKESFLSRQCVDRRIGDDQTLERELQAWNAARNLEASKVTWQFTTADARIKLRHLYPQV